MFKNAILGTVLLGVMAPGFVVAQGMIMSKADRDAKAERFMLEYIQKVDQISCGIAAIARSQVWTADADRTADFVHGYIRDKKQEFSYSAKGISSIGLPAGVRMWTQHIERNKEKYARYGAGDSNDEFFDYQEGKRNSPEDLPRFFANPRFIEPFSLPVSCRADLLMGRLREDYPTVTYLKNGRYVGSEVGPEGRIVGVWQVYGENGSVVDVAFSKKDHHFPEQVVFRRASGRHTIADRKDCDMFAITQTSWEKMELEDGTVIVLPQSIGTVALEMGSRIPKYEMVVRFKWALDQQRMHQLPDMELVRSVFGTGYDWRELLKERVTDDWGLSFREATASWDEDDR
jgi:hypothetical protein